MPWSLWCTKVSTAQEGTLWPSIASLGVCGQCEHLARRKAAGLPPKGGNHHTCGRSPYSRVSHRIYTWMLVHLYMDAASIHGMLVHLYMDAASTHGCLCIYA